MKPYMRKNSRFRERLMKTTKFTVALLIATTLILGSAVSATYQEENTDIKKENEIENNAETEIEKNIANALTDSKPSLTKVDHDMGIVSINELESGLAQSFDPTVTVENLGDNDETNIPVNLLIGTWEPVNDSRTLYDFEYDDGGFVPSADWDPVGDWEYTDSYDVNQYQGTHDPPPTAHSGDGMWGTVIYDDYTNAGGTSFLKKTVDFSGVTGAFLNFWCWSDMFGNFDYGTITIDGFEVFYIDDYPGTAWEYFEIDLSAWDGQVVEISFNFYATTVVEYAGWYIDDVEINDVETQFVPEYNETVTVDALSGATVDAIFPLWTPADLGVTENKNIRYTAFTEVNCPDDSNPANDKQNMTFILVYTWFHDIGVGDILSPEDGNAAVFSPEAVLENGGLNPETAVPVTMKIGRKDVTTIMDESFEDPDVLDPWTQVQYGTSNGIWQRFAYGSHTYEPAGTGDYYLDGWDQYGADFNTGIFSPVIDCSGFEKVLIEYEYNFRLLGAGEGEVNIYSGDMGNLEQNLNSWSSSSAGHAAFEIDPSDFDEPSIVYIEFYYYDENHSSTTYGLTIDDVKFTGINWVNEYDETVYVDVPFDSSVNAVFPDWIPAAIGVEENVDIEYNAQVEVNCPNDNNTVNDENEKLFTLHYGWFHDIGVNDILSPVGGVGSTQTPEVEIGSFGQNDETGAQVTMTIDEIAYTNQWTQVQYSGQGIWERTDDSYSQPDYGSGFFMVADSDAHNGWTYDVEIFTHSMDMTGETSVDFYCAENFQDLGSDDTAQIGIYSGGVLQETAYYQYGVDDPSGGGVVNYNFDPSGYPDPSDVQIGFYYNNGGDVYDWGFGIDDIYLASATVTYIVWDFEMETFPPTEMAFINIYDETATFDIGIGETINVILPDWTPAAPLSNIDYRVMAYTTLTNDNNTDNDYRTEFITLEYLHDVGTESITQWPNGRTRDMWDVQLFVDVGGQQGTTGLVGAEFDGTYFYNCQFNSPNIFRYDADGNYVDTFTIPGVDTIIDMAYDGTYMYGASANNANAIFEMDMDSETLVSTISTSALCWNIAYNEDSDTFYVGQWSNGFYEIDRSGAILNNLAIPESMLGIAYDNGLDISGYNGPFLWIFTGTSTGLDGIIKLYDLDTQTLVPGYDHNVDADLGPCIAGGLFFTTDFISGKATLGGMAQGDVDDYLFCYEMYDVSGGGGNMYEPGTYPVEGIIMNYGTYTEVDFNVHAEILDENGTVFWEDDAMVATPMNPGDTQTVSFDTVTFDEVAEHEGEYDLVITTELVGDEMPANDDESWTFIISIYDDIPPETTHELTGTVGDDDWYVSDVTITLTATDPWPYISPSGVNNTYYSFVSDTGPWEEYTAPIIVDEDGDFEFWYYSDDYNGNEEDVNTGAFKRDATPPTIDLTADGSGGTWTLTATVNDDTSGIAKVEFYVNNEFLGEVTSEPYEWEYTGASSGDIAQAIAYDNAGNSKVSDPVESFNNMQSQSNLVQRVQRQDNL